MLVVGQLAVGGLQLALSLLALAALGGGLCLLAVYIGLPLLLPRLLRALQVVAPDHEDEEEKEETGEEGQGHGTPRQLRGRRRKRGRRRRWVEGKAAYSDADMAASEARGSGGGGGRGALHVSLRLYPRLVFIVRHVRVHRKTCDALSYIWRGGLPLRVKEIAFDELRIVFEGALRGKMPWVSLRGLDLTAEIMHVGEWDAEDFIRGQLGAKHALANRLTDIIDPPRRSPIAWWQRVVDWTINRARLALSNVHIRIVDRKSHNSLGLILKRLTIEPQAPTADSLHETPRRIDIAGFRFYVDPYLAAAQSPSDCMLRFSRVTLILDFPDILQAMTQPSARPQGRGKRLRLSGHFYDAHAVVHEVQMPMLLYVMLRAFSVYEYLTWKADIGHALASAYRGALARPALEAEYQRLFAQLHAYRHHRPVFEEFEAAETSQASAAADAASPVRTSGTRSNGSNSNMPAPGRGRRVRLSRRRVQDIEQRVLELERGLNLPGILRLRRKACGWSFPTPSDSQPRDDLLPYGAHAAASTFASQDDAMSAYLAGVRPQAEDAMCPLRDLILEPLVLHGLTATFCDAPPTNVLRPDLSSAIPNTASQPPPTSRRGLPEIARRINPEYQQPAPAAAVHTSEEESRGVPVGADADSGQDPDESDVDDDEDVDDVEDADDHTGGMTPREPSSVSDSGGGSDTLDWHVSPRSSGGRRAAATAAGETTRAPSVPTASRMNTDSVPSGQRRSVMVGLAGFGGTRRNTVRAHTVRAFVRILLATNTSAQKCGATAALSEPDHAFLETGGQVLELSLTDERAHLPFACLLEPKQQQHQQQAGSRQQGISSSAGTGEEKKSRGEDERAATEHECAGTRGSQEDASSSDPYASLPRVDGQPYHVDGVFKLWSSGRMFIGGKIAQCRVSGGLLPQIMEMVWLIVRTFGRPPVTQEAVPLPADLDDVIQRILGTAPVDWLSQRHTHDVDGANTPTSTRAGMSFATLRVDPELHEDNDIHLSASHASAASGGSSAGHSRPDSAHGSEHSAYSANSDDQLADNDAFLHARTPSQLHEDRHLGQNHHHQQQQHLQQEQRDLTATLEGSGVSQRQLLLRGLKMTIDARLSDLDVMLVDNMHTISTSAQILKLDLATLLESASTRESLDVRIPNACVVPCTLRRSYDHLRSWRDAQLRVSATPLVHPLSLALHYRSTIDDLVWQHAQPQTKTLPLARQHIGSTASTTSARHDATNQEASNGPGAETGARLRHSNSVIDEENGQPNQTDAAFGLPHEDAGVSHTHTVVRVKVATVSMFNVANDAAAADTPSTLKRPWLTVRVSDAARRVRGDGTNSSSPSFNADFLFVCDATATSSAENGGTSGVHPSAAANQLPTAAFGDTDADSMRPAWATRAPTEILFELTDPARRRHERRRHAAEHAASDGRLRARAHDNGLVARARLPLKSSKNMEPVWLHLPLLTEDKSLVGELQALVVVLDQTLCMRVQALQFQRGTTLDWTSCNVADQTTDHSSCASTGAVNSGSEESTPTPGSSAAPTPRTMNGLAASDSTADNGTVTSAAHPSRKGSDSSTDSDGVGEDTSDGAASQDPPTSPSSTIRNFFAGLKGRVLESLGDSTAPRSHRQHEMSRSSTACDDDAAARRLFCVVSLCNERSPFLREHHDGLEELCESADVSARGASPRSRLHVSRSARQVLNQFPWGRQTVLVPAGEATSGQAKRRTRRPTPDDNAQTHPMGSAPTVPRHGRFLPEAWTGDANVSTQRLFWEARTRQRSPRSSSAPPYRRSPAHDVSRSNSNISSNSNSETEEVSKGRAKCDAEEDMDAPFTGPPRLLGLLRPRLRTEAIESLMWHENEAREAMREQELPMPRAVPSAGGTSDHGHDSSSNVSNADDDGNSHGDRTSPATTEISGFGGVVAANAMAATTAASSAWFRSLQAVGWNVHDHLEDTEWIGCPLLPVREDLIFRCQDSERMAIVVTLVEAEQQEVTNDSAASGPVHQRGQCWRLRPVARGVVAFAGIGKEGWFSLCDETGAEIARLLVSLELSAGTNDATAGPGGVRAADAADAAAGAAHESWGNLSPRTVAHVAGRAERLAMLDAQSTFSPQRRAAYSVVDGVAATGVVAGNDDDAAVLSDVVDAEVVISREIDADIRSIRAHVSLLEALYLLRAVRTMLGAFSGKAPPTPAQIVAAAAVQAAKAAEHAREAAAAAKLEEERTRARAHALRIAFQEFDVDQNGQLTLDEICQLVQRVDTNHELTRSEIAAKARHFLLYADYDADHSLTFDEIASALEYELGVSLRPGRGPVRTVRRHAGSLLPECSAFASNFMASPLLGSSRSLARRLAKLELEQGNRTRTEIWRAIETELGTSASAGISLNELERLQLKLVRVFRNYWFAKEVWSLVVVPSLAGSPSIGRVNVRSSEKYELLPCPLVEGTRVFVDVPHRLVWMCDAFEHVPFTGIRTANVDRPYGGRMFLQFEVSHACVLLLAMDDRRARPPSWCAQAGFSRTDLTLQTTHSTYRCWAAVVSGHQKVILGGADNRSALNVTNYFVLACALDAIDSLDPNSLFIFQNPKRRKFGGGDGGDSGGADLGSAQKRAGGDISHPVHGRPRVAAAGEATSSSSPSKSTRVAMRVSGAGFLKGADSAQSRSENMHSSDDENAAAADVSQRHAGKTLTTREGDAFESTTPASDRLSGRLHGGKRQRLANLDRKAGAGVPDSGSESGRGSGSGNENGSSPDRGSGSDSDSGSGSESGKVSDCSSDSDIASHRSPKRTTGGDWSSSGAHDHRRAPHGRRCTVQDLQADRDQSFTGVHRHHIPAAGYEDTIDEMGGEESHRHWQPFWSRLGFPSEGTSPSIAGALPGLPGVPSVDVTVSAAATGASTPTAGVSVPTLVAANFHGDALFVLPAPPPPTLLGDDGSPRTRLFVAALSRETPLTSRSTRALIRDIQSTRWGNPHMWACFHVRSLLWLVSEDTPAGGSLSVSHALEAYLHTMRPRTRTASLSDPLRKRRSLRDMFGPRRRANPLRSGGAVQQQQHEEQQQQQRLRRAISSGRRSPSQSPPPLLMSRSASTRHSGTRSPPAQPSAAGGAADSRYPSVGAAAPVMSQIDFDSEYLDDGSEPDDFCVLRVRVRQRVQFGVRLVDVNIFGRDPSIPSGDSPALHIRLQCVQANGYLNTLPSLWELEAYFPPLPAVLNYNARVDRRPEVSVALLGHAAVQDGAVVTVAASVPATDPAVPAAAVATEPPRSSLPTPQSQEKRSSSCGEDAPPPGLFARLAISQAVAMLDRVQLAVYNPIVHAVENVLEPWSVVGTIAKHGACEQPQLSVVCNDHLSVNICSSLVHTLSAVRQITSRTKAGILLSTTTQTPAVTHSKLSASNARREPRQSPTTIGRTRSKDTRHVHKVGHHDRHHHHNQSQQERKPARLAVSAATAAADSTAAAVTGGRFAHSRQQAPEQNNKIERRIARRRKRRGSRWKVPTATVGRTRKPSGAGAERPPQLAKLLRDQQHEQQQRQQDAASEREGLQRQHRQQQYSQATARELIFVAGGAVRDVTDDALSSHATLVLDNQTGETVQVHFLLPDQDERFVDLGLAQRKRATPPVADLTSPHEQTPSEGRLRPQEQDADMHANHTERLERSDVAITLSGVRVTVQHGEWKELRIPESLAAEFCAAVVMEVSGGWGQVHCSQLDCPGARILPFEHPYADWADQFDPDLHGNGSDDGDRLIESATGHFRDSEDDLGSGLNLVQQSPAASVNGDNRHASRLHGHGVAGNTDGNLSSDMDSTDASTPSSYPRRHLKSNPELGDLGGGVVSDGPIDDQYSTDGSAPLARGVQSAASAASALSLSEAEDDRRSDQSRQRDHSRGGGRGQGRDRRNRVAGSHRRRSGSGSGSRRQHVHRVTNPKHFVGLVVDTRFEQIERIFDGTVPAPPAPPPLPPASINGAANHTQSRGIARIAGGVSSALNWPWEGVDLKLSSLVNAGSGALGLGSTTEAAAVAGVGAQASPDGVSILRDSPNLSSDAGGSDDKAADVGLPDSGTPRITVADAERAQEQQPGHHWRQNSAFMTPTRGLSFLEREDVPHEDSPHRSAIEAVLGSALRPGTSPQAKAVSQNGRGATLSGGGNAQRTRLCSGSNPAVASSSLSRLLEQHDALLRDNMQHMQPGPVRERCTVIHAVLRSNVRLQNSTASAIAVSLDPPPPLMASEEDDESTQDNGEEREVWIEERDTVPVPLPTLARQWFGLRRAADSNNNSSSSSNSSSATASSAARNERTDACSVQFPLPALDPSMPDPLRRTKEFTERSVLLLPNESTSVPAATALVAAAVAGTSPIAAAAEPVGSPWRTRRLPTGDASLKPDFGTARLPTSGSSTSSSGARRQRQGGARQEREGGAGGNDIDSFPLGSGAVAHVVPRDWTLTVLPAYQFVNALPCDIEIEVIQPAQPWKLPESKKDKDAGSDGAVDLFYLPDDLFVRSSQMRRIERRGAKVNKSTWRPFKDPGGVGFWRGKIECGGEADLSSILLDRSLHIRVRCRFSRTWSECFTVHASMHMARHPFHTHRAQLLQWPTVMGEAALFDRVPPQIRVQRQWLHNSSRRLIFYSMYWLLNKTGLSLWYMSVTRQEKAHQHGVPCPAPPDVTAVGTFGQECWRPSEGHPHERDGDDARAVGSDNGMHAIVQPPYGGYETAHAVAAALHQSPGSEIGVADENHQQQQQQEQQQQHHRHHHHHHRQQQQSLQPGADPHAVGDDDGEAGIFRTDDCVYEEEESDVETPGVHEASAHLAQLARLVPDYVTADSAHVEFFSGRTRYPLMVDCPDHRLSVMPYGMASQVTSPQLFISNLLVRSRHTYRMARPFRVGSHIYVDESRARVTQVPQEIEEHGSNTVVVLTADSDRQSDPDAKRFMSFVVSHDADVYVCIDARGRQPPGWLSAQGFHPLHTRVHTTSVSTSYIPYRKTYRANCRVQIGGNRMQCTHTVAIPSGNASGSPAMALRSDDRMAHNYFVVLTPPLYAEREPCVTNIRVQRNLADSIVCRAPYQLHNALELGTPIYVDRDKYVVTSIPDVLCDTMVAVVRTARADRRSDSERLLRFRVRQDSYVMLCHDDQALSRPVWFDHLGAVDTRLRIEGSHNLRFRVSAFIAPRGHECCFGGNRRFTASSMYFVLLATMEEAHASNLPMPLRLQEQCKKLFHEKHAHSALQGGLRRPPQHRLHGSYDPSSASTVLEHEYPQDYIHFGGGGGALGLASQHPGLAGHWAGAALGPEDDLDEEDETTPATDSTGEGESESASASASETEDAKDGDEHSNTDSKHSNRGNDSTKSGQLPRSMASGLTRTRTRSRARSFGHSGGDSARIDAHVKGDGAEANGVAPLEDRQVAFPRDVRQYWPKRGSLGQLHVHAPPFDYVSRAWSDPFDVRNTQGELQTNLSSIAVSIQPLPGLFHRSAVVTLLPRFVVVNNLRITLDVFPRVVYLSDSASPDSLASVVDSLRDDIAQVLGHDERYSVMGDNLSSTLSDTASGGGSAGPRSSSPTLSGAAASSRASLDGRSGFSTAQSASTLASLQVAGASAGLAHAHSASALPQARQAMEMNYKRRQTERKRRLRAQQRKKKQGTAGGANPYRPLRLPMLAAGIVHNFVRLHGVHSGRGGAGRAGVKHPHEQDLSGTAARAQQSPQGGQTTGHSHHHVHARETRRCLFVRTPQCPHREDLSVPILLDAAGEMYFWLRNVQPDVHSPENATSSSSSSPAARGPRSQLQQHRIGAGHESPTRSSAATPKLKHQQAQKQPEHQASGDMIVCASVSAIGPTVVVAFRDASNAPPYRLENRSPLVSLVYRQRCRGAIWRELPPLSWRSFIWENPLARKELVVAVQGFESSAQVYKLDEIKQLEPLPVPQRRSKMQAALASLQELVNAIAVPPETSLSVQVLARGLTRVLQFVHLPTPSLVHAADDGLADELLDATIRAVEEEHAAGNPFSSTKHSAKRPTPAGARGPDATLAAVGEQKRTREQEQEVKGEQEHELSSKHTAAPDSDEDNGGDGGHGRRVNSVESPPASARTMAVSSASSDAIPSPDTPSSMGVGEAMDLTPSSERGDEDARLTDHERLSRGGKRHPRTAMGSHDNEDGLLDYALVAGGVRGARSVGARGAGGGGGATGVGVGSSTGSATAAKLLTKPHIQSRRGLAARREAAAAKRQVDGAKEQRSMGERGTKEPDSSSQPLQSQSLLQRQQYGLSILPFDVSMQIAGLSITVAESHTRGPIEILSLVVDRFEVAVDNAWRTAHVSIFHFQIDDMRQHARFPVVLQPTDSGFNSHMRAATHVYEVPVARFSVEWEATSASSSAPSPSSPSPPPSSSSTGGNGATAPTTRFVHLRNAEIVLQQLSSRVDIEFVVVLVSFVGKLLHGYAEGGESAEASVRRRTARAVSTALSRHVDVGDALAVRSHQASDVVYCQMFHHSSLTLMLELYVGQRVLEFDPATMEGSVALGFAYLGTPLLQVLSSIVGSFAHTSPTFTFNELLVNNFYGSPKQLGNALAMSLARQAAAQSYKLFGSMELLGDPLSLVNNLGTGVMEFFRKTHDEITGDADTRGEGVRHLVHAVVGGTFGSAAKITGSLAEMVQGATAAAGVGGNDPAGHGVDGGSGGGGGDAAAGADAAAAPVGAGGHMGDAVHNGVQRNHRQGSAVNGEETGTGAQPENIGSGLKQGGRVFMQSIRTGFNGVADEPARGLREEGAVGAAKGVVRGIVGLMASPLVGALGALSVVSAGVTASTQLVHARPLGRRREPRSMASMGGVRALQPLRDGFWMVQRVDNVYLSPAEVHAFSTATATRASSSEAMRTGTDGGDRGGGGGGGSGDGGRARLPSVAEEEPATAEIEEASKCTGR